MLKKFLLIVTAAVLLGGSLSVLYAQEAGQSPAKPAPR